MGKKTRSDYTLLNIISGLGGYALNILLGFVGRVIFARVFSAEYLGVSGLFTNVLNMLSLAELGIGTAIVYALYAPLAKNDNEKIATLVRFYGKCYRIIAVVMAAIGLALIPFLNVIVKDRPNIDENFYLLYLIFLFNTVSGYFFAYRATLLTAAQKNYIVNVVSNISLVIQHIMQIILMLSTGNYIAYLLVISVFGMVQNIVSSEIAKRQYPCIKNKNAPPLSNDEKHSLIRNVRAMTITKIGGLLVNSTDNIIITYFGGLATVGLSSNYTFFTANISTLLRIVFNSVNASVGNHNALEDNNRRHSLFKAINLCNFWIYGWAAIGVFVVATDAVKLLFGEQYVLDLSIPLILSLNFYIVGMQNAVWTYINTLGLFRHGRYLVLLTAAINLVASFALGEVWGLFGIYFASVLSRVLTNTWYSPYALYKYGFKIPVRHYFKRYAVFALVLVIAGGLSWFVCSFISFKLVIVNVLLKFVICCIIPNSVFLLFFGKSEEFKILKGFASGIINKVLNKIKKQKS